MSVHVLKLNASGEPIEIITARDAVRLLVGKKVEVIAAGTISFRYEKGVMEIPSVIRLKTYVKIPYRGTVKWSRKNVLQRDSYTCQYCFHKGDEVDHVFPRARGGKNTWSNTVCACRSCNGKKGNKTLEQLGWQLLNKPYTPKETRWIVIGREMNPAWEPYLPKVS